MDLNSTRPNTMNEKPPKCCLGCCNVRSWILAVSIINVVILTMLILGNIFSITTSPIPAISLINMSITLIYTNLKLRRGVLKHDIASVRLWVWVYSILFTLLAFLSFFVFKLFPFIIAEKQLVVILIVLTVHGVLGLLNYLVYQYYNFQKTRLRRPELSPENQNI